MTSDGFKGIGQFIVFVALVFGVVGIVVGVGLRGCRNAAKTARRLGVSDLQLRVKRLESFVREYTRCPCCDDERRCDQECEHQKNAPEQHAEMVAAREALYGEEVPRE